MTQGSVGSRAKAWDVGLLVWGFGCRVLMLYIGKDNTINTEQQQMYCLPSMANGSLLKGQRARTPSREARSILCKPSAASTTSRGSCPGPGTSRLPLSNIAGRGRHVQPQMPE